MRLRFWDGYDVYYDETDGRWEQRYGQNLSDAQGRYIEFDSYWAFQDPELLVHEALHYYLNEINSPMMGEDAHAWIYAEQKNCV